MSIGFKDNIGGGGNINIDISQLKSENPLIDNKTGAWYEARDKCIIKNTSNIKNSYKPILSVKSYTGDWSIGNLQGENSLSFVFCKDENYENKNNVINRITLPPFVDGEIITSNTNGLYPFNYNGTKIKLIPNHHYYNEYFENDTSMKGFFNRLIKWLCANYTNEKNTIYVGNENPNCESLTIIKIYNTNDLNSEGYPRYAIGWYLDYDNLPYSFGFANFNYYEIRPAHEIHSHSDLNEKIQDLQNQINELKNK